MSQPEHISKIMDRMGMEKTISERTYDTISESIKNMRKEEFFDWWENGCRSGEKEKHNFSKDCPSDAWLAKEAWLAAVDYMIKMNSVVE